MRCIMRVVLPLIGVDIGIVDCMGASPPEPPPHDVLPPPDIDTPAPRRWTRWFRR